MKLRHLLTVSFICCFIIMMSYATAGDETEIPDRATATKRLRGAAIEGWSKTAEAAIRYGADVDETDEYGTTPLILASLRGHDRIVRLLLEAGADPNHENDDHLSPLIAASGNCNSRVVTLLLKKGANPNSRSLTRQTPLMRAAENGCAFVVQELLLTKGIDLRATDETNRTALDYARESSILGLDYGESFALIDGVRREALVRTNSQKKKIRKPVKLPNVVPTPLL